MGLSEQLVAVVLAAILTTLIALSGNSILHSIEKQTRKLEAAHNADYVVE